MGDFMHLEKHARQALVVFKSNKALTNGTSTYEVFETLASQAIH